VLNVGGDHRQPTGEHKAGIADTVRARFLPSPRLRGEGGERSEPGEGLRTLARLCPSPGACSDSLRMRHPLPAARGEGSECAARSCIHIAQPALAKAPPPVFFGRRRVRPLSSAFALSGFGATSRPPSNEYRGRAGHLWAQRTHGPRRLATSRLVEFGPSPRGEQGHRKSASPSGVPRAVFEVCSASPPVDVPFRRPCLSFRIGRPPIHRCRAQVVAAVQ
jgi:hypothetical protein